MVKYRELIIGNHGFEDKCEGCLRRSLIARQNEVTTIFLTVVEYNEKENTLKPIFYCDYHAGLVLEELKKDLSKSIVPNFSIEKYDQWKKEWDGIMKNLQKRLRI